MTQSYDAASKKLTLSAKQTQKIDVNNDYPQTEFFQGYVDAALAIVGATGKGDPRAFPLIFEQFKKAFDATNVQGIISSMNAFIKIADPRGQEAFDMLKVKFKDQPGAIQAITQFESQFKAALKP